MGVGSRQHGFSCFGQVIVNVGSIDLEPVQVQVAFKGVKVCIALSRRVGVVEPIAHENLEVEGEVEATPQKE